MISTAELAPRLIRHSERLLAWFLPGESRRLVVSFSDIGADDGVPGPQFVGSAVGRASNSVLFIADPARSWLNAPGLTEEIIALIDTFRQETGAAQVSGIGHSMGGFMAMALAAEARFETTVALAPQFSVRPAFVGPGRFRRWHTRIPAFRYEDLRMLVDDQTAHFVVHGDATVELCHAQNTVKLPGVRQFLLPGRKHGFPRQLKKLNLLAPLIAAGIEARVRRFRLLIERVGGFRVAADDTRLIGRAEPEVLPDSPPPSDYSAIPPALLLKGHANDHL